MIKTAWSIALILMAFNLSSAPTIEDSTALFFKRIVDLYTPKDLLSFNISMMQKDSAGTKILYSSHGKVEQSLGRYRLSFPEYMQIAQDTFRITVMNKTKNILVQHIKLEEGKNFDILNMSALKKFLTDKKIRIQLNNIKGHIASYSLIFNEIDENAYRIYIDANTGYILSVHVRYYDYDDAENIVLRNMDIIYSNYKIGRADRFEPLAEVFEVKNGKIELKKKYSEYKLD